MTERLFVVRSEPTGEWALPERQGWTPDRRLAGLYTLGRADKAAETMLGGDRSAISIVPADTVPPCDYCGGAAALEPKTVMFPHRPDLADRYIWRCAPCGAWVGCHPGTTRPLGRLADADLRAAKQNAHAWFDPLWQAKIRRDGCSRSAARKAGYGWLAEQLGLDRRTCHIGMFDVATCERVVEVCRAVRAGKAA